MLIVVVVLTIRNETIFLILRILGEVMVVVVMSVVRDAGVVITKTFRSFTRLCSRHENCPLTNLIARYA